MTKLDRLLDRATEIHRMQKRLLTKNKLTSLRLECLPKEDYKEWQRLSAIDTKIGKAICEAISKK